MSNHRAPYRYWAIEPIDPDDPRGPSIAKCRCGLREQRDSYTSARTTLMYHYYVCPKRWEIFEDDEPFGN